MTTAAARRGAAKLRPAAAEIDSENSIDALASRDRESDENVNLIDVDMAIAAMTVASKLPVYSTGFESLDRASGHGGFLAQTLNPVAAGPGIGKTTFSTNLSVRIGQKWPVIYATNEMTPEMLLAKIAAAEHKVSANDVYRRRALTDDELRRSLPQRYTWKYRPTVGSLRRAIDATSQKYGVAPFVVVDYLNPMVDSSAPDARLAVTAVSGQLRDMAVETTSPFLVVSAASRVGSQRAQSARKQAPAALIDVARESGAVEYDATMLIVASAENETDDDGWDVCTLTVAKSRWGRPCHIDMRYHGATAQWRDAGIIERELAAPKRDKMQDEILASLARATGPVSFRALIGKGEGRERLVRGRDADIKAHAETMAKDGLITIVNGYYALARGAS